MFGAAGKRADEAKASADAFLASAATAYVRSIAFRDGYFPYVGGEIKDVFEELKAEVDPDVIFTHTRGDLHQDHRLVNELTWNTWRDHLILEYEVPKYDGDLGAPNAFVPLPEATLAREGRAPAPSFRLAAVENAGSARTCSRRSSASAARSPLAERTGGGVLLAQARARLRRRSCTLPRPKARGTRPTS